MTTSVELAERKARLIAQSDLQRMQALLAFHEAKRIISPPPPAERSQSSRSIAATIIGLAVPLVGNRRLRGALRYLSLFATAMRVFRAWRAG
ncbi:MAG: hypothetical protein U1F10_15185 [Burkholderiales bacterium]